MKEVPEEEDAVEVNHFPRNGNNDYDYPRNGSDGYDHVPVSEIQEEPGTNKAVQIETSPHVRGSRKENAIRRETEIEFRLSGRREDNRYGGGIFFVLKENEGQQAEMHGLHEVFG